MIVSTKLAQGLAMMKYALNHPWHFFSYKLAFLTGFLQCTMVFYSEAIKICVLLLSPDINMVLIRFIELAIISEIDKYFFNAVSERNAKDFITQFMNEEDVGDKPEEK